MAASGGGGGGAASPGGAAVLGMGNPLLDISAQVSAAFLAKYGLEPANAILAEEQHLPMYAELAAMKGVDYIGGGSTLNSIRVAQWLGQSQGRTAYMGCLGKDEFGRILAKCAREDGVACHWQEDAKAATGTCAVCITDKERSLVANLAAANCFTAAHLATDRAKALFDAATVLYTAGFFVTVSPEAMVLAGEHALARGKSYAVNLSATFVVEFFKDQFAPAMALASHVFGNEDEGAAFAKANGLEYASMADLAKQMAAMPSQRRPRTVVLTQGKQPTVVATSDGEVREFPVALVPADKVVDVNGAGDAFVGGYLAMLARGASVAQCVRAGQFAASYIIQRSGTKLEGVPDFRA